MLPNTQGRLPLKRASLRFPDNSEHRGARREVPQGFNGIPPNTIYLQFLTRGNRGEVGVKSSARCLISLCTDISRTYPRKHMIGAHLHRNIGSTTRRRSGVRISVNVGKFEQDNGLIRSPVRSCLIPFGTKLAGHLDEVLTDRNNLDTRLENADLAEIVNHYDVARPGIDPLVQRNPPIS